MNSSNKNILDLQTDTSETENWLSEEEFDMMEKDLMKQRDK